MGGSESARACLICNKPNAKLCTRCKGASYCSEACQRSDYAIHKLLCASFSEFDIASRPTANHVQAIHFPVNQDKPELIWLEFWDDNGSKHPITFKLLGLNDNHTAPTPVKYNYFLKRRPSNIVYIAYRESYSTDGSTPNKSIANIIATWPGFHHDWRGSIVAYGLAGPDPDRIHNFRDVDLHDFRHVTDHLISLRQHSSSPLYSPANTSIKGVRINCVGDRVALNQPRFEEVNVSVMDMLFPCYDTSDIADLVGLPIFTKKCSPHPSWANSNDEGAYSNVDATYLHLCCDPNVTPSDDRKFSWGLASRRWRVRVGSIIVVRQDQKPLSRWHVEALCRYCQYEAAAYLAHSVGAYPDEPISKELVLSIICRPAFSIFWSKVREEEQKKGGDISGITSPYLV